MPLSGNDPKIPRPLETPPRLFFTNVLHPMVDTKLKTQSGRKRRRIQKTKVIKRKRTVAKNTDFFMNKSITISKIRTPQNLLRNFLSTVLLNFDLNEKISRDPEISSLKTLESFSQNWSFFSTTIT